MDFSGSLEGDTRIPKIAILTTINHHNFILTQLWTAKGGLSALSAWKQTHQLIWHEAHGLQVQSLFTVKKRGRCAHFRSPFSICASFTLKLLYKTQLGIHHFHKDHNAPCLPSKILHNRYLRFLFRRLWHPGKTEIWERGVNKVHLVFENDELTSEHLTRKAAH